MNGSRQGPDRPGETTLPEFGRIDPERIVAQDELFVVVRDKFPVSPGHTLIIARRPLAWFQELNAAEKARLWIWVDWAQKHLTATLNPAPDAFNFGLNDGPAAGQTIAQLHFHVIPRYTGDVPDPRGGVRWVIPANARYWTGSVVRRGVAPESREDRKGRSNGTPS